MSAISCQQHQFGKLATGQTVTSYSLRNTSGMTVSILNYGAILNSIKIPDSRGETHEITQGISQAESLDSIPLSGITTAHLPPRYGVDFSSLNRNFWDAESGAQEDIASVKLSRQGSVPLKYSNSELGYRCTIQYTLTDSNELVIASTIHTTLALPVFMTTQLIWDLTRGKSEAIADHVLQLWSSRYFEVDHTGCLSSEPQKTALNAAFDFQKPQRLGEQRQQISKELAYDVCFDINELTDTEGYPLVARIKAPVSGRSLEVYTQQAGIRFYLHPTHASAFQGFALAPMPLTTASTPAPAHSDIISQETRYKLIW